VDDKDCSEPVIGDLAKLFQALDMSFSDEHRKSLVEEMFSELANRMPSSGWRVVAAAVCPTGELLVSSLESCGNKTKSSTTCVFPGSDDFGNYLTTSYESIVAPLDNLIHASQQQLRTASTGAIMKEEDKRDWWRMRDDFDMALQSLVGKVEVEWLGSESAQRTLVGIPREIRQSPEGTDDDHFCGNLASKFEAASLPETDDLKSIEATLKTKTVSELKEELRKLGIRDNKLRNLKKAELVSRLREESERNLNTQGEFDDSEGDPNSCTILILDENLQRFPFEGMSSLNRRSVCRLPSLPFLVAKLVELSSTSSTTTQEYPRINPELTSYVLDPEANLPKTADRIGAALQVWNRHFGEKWNGVTGAVPTKEFVESGLTARNGLFLYFGHGSGQGFYSRSDVENLVEGRDVNGEESIQRKARAAVVLMGCSSVKLESINRKGTEAMGEELPIYYEPEGIALSYISSGAPCVVGNLWDVTDHDIDRFSIDMLERFFDERSSRSLAECVAASRSACKMRYIVGCAPVCYGIPVFKSSSASRD